MALLASLRSCLKVTLFAGLWLLAGDAFAAAPTPTPVASNTSTAVTTGTVTPQVTATFSPSPIATNTAVVTATAAPTSTLQTTVAGTPSTPEPSPLPTGTAVAPMVLDRNIFRPGKGGPPMAINFKPPQDGHVTVRIFNLAGENVRKPYEADVAAGAWIQAHWDGTNAQGERVAAGMYFISVQGAGIHSLKKVILLK